EIANISKAGADVIHLDVMDGVFVKNITFGHKFVKETRKYSDKIFDAHLMIVEPWKHVEDFAKAGADYITVHYEACNERLKDTLKQIKSCGAKCGAVINPDTEVSAIKNVIEECDMLLLMSVFPGLGGQSYIESVTPKIKEARKLIDATGKDILLEVDGGITLSNVGKVKAAGANVLVAGSTVYAAADHAKVIEELRNL
ncbi:MAG: ribulose-phosphate 3-epimerase, partial [Clostridia bacterium]|nr:ribulose-phosphate 3-epimerase [Clostridia bacterium]